MHRGHIIKRTKIHTSQWQLQQQRYILQQLKLTNDKINITVILRCPDTCLTSLTLTASQPELVLTTTACALSVSAKAKMFYSRGDHVQHMARRPESSCGPPNKKVGHPCSTSDCVIVSEDLKWEKQCSAAVQKANKMLGMIKRNFTDRSKETVMALYKRLVRPHLEYCVQIWNPYFIKDIKLLEGVQRRVQN